MSGKKHTTELKRAIINEMLDLGLTSEEAAERHGISPATINRWKRKLAASMRRTGAAAATFPPRGAVDMAALKLEIRATVQALLPAALHDEIVRMARAVSRRPPPRRRRTKR